MTSWRSPALPKIVIRTSSSKLASLPLNSMDFDAHLKHCLFLVDLFEVESRGLP